MLRNDTTDDAHAVQCAVLRRFGPERRMTIAAEMSEAAREIAFAGEQQRHSSLTPAEARLRVLERVWGTQITAAMRARSDHD